MSGQPRNFITIVSGLPRSGTSMMMRMLEAGGMPIMLDQNRPADIDNPLGYYEFEPVKHLKEDSRWLAGAVGKAVKVIYVLLYDLPRDYAYRLIVMRRDVQEVVASQEAMLARLGGATSGASRENFVSLFETHLRQVDAWVASQHNISLLNVEYAQVIQAPAATARRVADFLWPLDAERMAAVVEPALYRRRLESGRGPVRKG